MAEPRGCCRYSGVYVRSFERDRWFLGCGRAPNRLTSASVDAVTGLAHLIQELYESLQIRLLQALNVRPQVLVTEQPEKELLIVGVGGVELLKPLPNLRNLF